MDILKRIQKIIQDHKAMNAVRKHNADVYLIATVGRDGHGFDCYTCQALESVAIDRDPSVAILNSFRTKQEWAATSKGTGTTPILTTWQTSFDND